jgi:hypothetical protein
MEYSANEEEKNAYRLFVGKPEGKRILEGSSRRWRDNIKMELRLMKCWRMDWINLAPDRGQWGGSCEDGNKTQGSKKCRKFLSSCTAGDFTRTDWLQEVSLVSYNAFKEMWK